MNFMIRYDINKFSEFDETLKSGFNIVIETKTGNCVVPEITGYLKDVITSEDNHLCALVLHSDNKSRERYTDYTDFVQCAFNGIVNGDMRIRLYDYNDLKSIYYKLGVNTSDVQTSFYVPKFYNLDKKSS